jgi:hypothetical protein
VGAVDNGGALVVPFYMVVGRQKAGSLGEGCSGDVTSMSSITGDGNVEGEVMGCGHFQRGRWGGGEVSPQC